MEQTKLKKAFIELISMIKNQALKTKKEVDSARKTQIDFLKGKIMGYYSIITLFKHQAFVFCIDQKELTLSEIDPQVDLLGLGRNTEIDPVEDNWAIDPLSEEKIKNYLIDSSIILKKQYIEAKSSLKKAKEIDREYSKGELAAYSCVISLLKDQAHAFNIDEHILGLSDIDPETDLGLYAKEDIEPHKP